MPRGQRPYKTNEEEIAYLEAKIKNYQDAIQDFKNRIQEIKAAKDKEDLEALLVAIRSSGKTVSEVLAEITGQQKTA